MKIFNVLTIILLAASFTFFSCVETTDKPCAETLWYADVDGDSFGDPEMEKLSCDKPVDYVENNEDADDTDADVNPNTIWSGSKMTFTKPDGADWTLPEYQDIITSKVGITRGAINGIFNPRQEASFQGGNKSSKSPIDTEWAFGNTDDFKSLNFQSWAETMAGCHYCVVDQEMVVHLISDNIYFDIKFTSWTKSVVGGGGAGFSYERSTEE